MTRPAPPSIRPPGYYTSGLGVLLAIAGTIAALYLWQETPGTGVLSAIAGWGFAGVLWALSAVAAQIRDGQRKP